MNSIIITIHPLAGRHTKQDIQTLLNILLIKYLIHNLSASIGQPLPGKVSLPNVYSYPLSAYHHCWASGGYRATMCGAITHTSCRSATYHYSGEPFTIVSGGPTQTHMSPTTAAGIFPIKTFCTLGPTIGPPTCSIGEGNAGICMGQACISVILAAGGIVFKLKVIN